MFEGLNVKKVCNMKKEIIRFFKMWTLPLGMLAGVGVYLMFQYIPLLMEKPRDFDPFGQAGFAHLWLQYD